MKQVLVTTTITVPEVLRRYREQGPDVLFIIAGDQKSPHEEIEALCGELGNADYLRPELQYDLYPELSDAIGWNCVQRRNIAILEAARMAPDVIVTIDDDNAPQSGLYFEQIEQEFRRESGTLVADDWFNVGDLCNEPYTYRGWPFSVDPPAAPTFEAARPRKVGVLNGLIYGDPDIGATERIERNPKAWSYSPVAMKGIALGPNTTWSPINSQNTAWRAELAPLMMVLPGVGRYDDIWGSYIAQSVMRATDYHVLFGVPYVTQDRHQHNLVDDLERELLGMRHTDALTDHLRSIRVDPEQTVVQNLQGVLGSLSGFEFMPHGFFTEWLAAWE